MVNGNRWSRLDFVSSAGMNHSPASRWMFFHIARRVSVIRVAWVNINTSSVTATGSALNASPHSASRSTTATCRKRAPLGLILALVK
ncbi:hypothetical protein D3C73_958700 [compost metagenome]